MNKAIDRGDNRQKFAESCRISRDTSRIETKNLSPGDASHQDRSRENASRNDNELMISGAIKIAVIVPLRNNKRLNVCRAMGHG